MEIDMTLRGAEQVASKAALMSRSMKGLESAWAKYNKASGGSFSGGGLLAGAMAAGRGAGGLGSVVGSTAAFITVGKVMEKLMSDATKEWAARQVKREMLTYTRLARGIALPFRKLASKVNLSRVAMNAMNNPFVKTITSMVSGWIAPIAKGMKSWFASSMLMAKQGSFAKVGLNLMDSPFVKTITSMIPGWLKYIPWRTIAVAVGAVLLLDSRVRDSVTKRINSAIEWASEKTKVALVFYGKKLDSLRVGLAKVMDNPYLAASRVNIKEAIEKLTPAEQKAYINDQIKKLNDDDMHVFVEKTKQELLDLYKNENEKRNMQILEIYDTMKYQGRI